MFPKNVTRDAFLDRNARTSRSAPRRVGWSRPGGPTVRAMDTSPTITIHTGEALTVLRTMPSMSVDVVICDPPYGLSDLPSARVTQAITEWVGGNTEFVPDGRGFMSMMWDRFVPPPAVWAECLRVLKPGGHLAAFSGARTQDLMGLSIRLGGFEIRDTLAWISASRFPKGAKVSEAVAKLSPDDAARWGGWSTTLKPAVEPIILARRPLEGSVAANLIGHGVGALNTDAVRVPFRDAADEAESKGKNRHGDYGTLNGGNAVYGDYGTEVRGNYDAEGRFPPNALFDPAAAAALDAQSGHSQSRKGKPRASSESGPGYRMRATGSEYDDFGGASRFFPVIDTPFFYAGRAPVSERPVVAGADGTPLRHVSVKPLALMVWLCKLLCPPDGTVLDPFAGSGTALEAARNSGFHSVGIELDPDHVRLIDKRLATEPGPDRGQVA